jgi:hypothetical protein
MTRHVFSPGAVWPCWRLCLAVPSARCRPRRGKAPQVAAPDRCGHPTGAERKSTHPFQTLAQDLVAWSILVTDMDAAQQRAAIILQLGGAARELPRSMSYQDVTHGVIIGGQQVDSVTFLLTHLAQQLAPLGGGGPTSDHQRADAVPKVSQRTDWQHAEPFMTLRY